MMFNVYSQQECFYGTMRDVMSGLMLGHYEY